MDLFNKSNCNNVDKASHLRDVIFNNFDPSGYDAFKNFADHKIYSWIVKTAQKGETAFTYDPAGIPVNGNATLKLHYTQRWLNQEMGGGFDVHFVYDNGGMSTIERDIEIDWTDIVFDSTSLGDNHRPTSQEISRAEKC